MKQLTLLIALSILWLSSKAQPFTPAQIRAPFLYHIAYYSTFSKRKPVENTVNFCFLENDSFEHMNHFERSPSKTVRSKAINIVAIRDINSAHENRCHILFVSKAQESEELYQEIRKLNTATISVGESAEFLEHGGLMSVIPTNAKMKIYINQEQYKNTSIKFSANLLKRVIFR
jgi:hypothetical protein